MECSCNQSYKERLKLIMVTIKNYFYSHFTYLYMYITWTYTYTYRICNSIGNGKINRFKTVNIRHSSIEQLLITVS